MANAFRARRHDYLECTPGFCGVSSSAHGAQVQVAGHARVLALLDRVLVAQPGARSVAVQCLREAQTLSVQLGLGLRVGRGLVVGGHVAVHPRDIDAHLGALEPIVRVLVLRDPRAVATAAEDVLLVAELLLHAGVEQLRHLLAQCLALRGVLRAEDAVFHLGHRLEGDVVDGRAEILGQHAVPAGGREVRCATGLVSAEAGVLVARAVERLFEQLAGLVQCPVGVAPDLHRRTALGVGQGGSEAVAHSHFLVTLVHLDGAVVDLVVPLIAGHVAGDPVVALILAEGFTGEEDLVERGRPSLLAVVHHEGAHGLGGGDARAGGQGCCGSDCHCDRRRDTLEPHDELSFLFQGSRCADRMSVCTVYVTSRADVPRRMLCRAKSANPSIASCP